MAEPACPASDPENRHANPAEDADVNRVQQLCSKQYRRRVGQQHAGIKENPATTAILINRRLPRRFLVSGNQHGWDFQPRGSSHHDARQLFPADAVR